MKTRKNGFSRGESCLRPEKKNHRQWNAKRQRSSSAEKFSRRKKRTRHEQLPSWWHFSNSLWLNSPSHMQPSHIILYENHPVNLAQKLKKLDKVYLACLVNEKRLAHFAWVHSFLLFLCCRWEEDLYAKSNESDIHNIRYVLVFHSPILNGTEQTIKSKCSR